MRKPTFILKPSAYKTNELYAVVPGDATGDANVSGYVGNGTRVAPNGLIEAVATDTPRVDYHQGVPGLLLEPTRKNFVDYSETLQDWTIYNGCTYTINNSIAPDGTYTAIFLEDDSATQSEYLLDATGYTVDDATAIHVFSIFAKKHTRDSFMLYAQSAGTTGYQAYVTCTFDGTIAISNDANSIITSVGSEKYSDGWYRFYMLIDMDNTDTLLKFGVFPSPDFVSPNPDIDGMGSLWVWGAQLEEGSFMTSYIPTSAGVSTRTNDIMSITNIVANGLVSLGNGAFFIEISTPKLSIRDGSGSAASMGGAGGGLYIKGTGNTTYSFAVYTDDTATATTIDYTSELKARILYNFTPVGIDVWINGTKVRAVVTDFYLISETFTLSGGGMASKIHEIALYPSKLTDTEAQAITR